MEYMQSQKNKCFDLAIVDPPYGIDAGSNKRAGTQTGKSLAKNKIYHSGNWDKDIPQKEYFEELKRVSENQIILSGNYFLDYLSNTRCMIVWDKDNGTNYYADCEIAWASFNSAVRKFRWRWHGFLQENNKNKQQRIHPKSIKIYQYSRDNVFIKSYPNAQIASKETHIPQSNINRCVNNKLKSAGGYLWKKI